MMLPQRCGLYYLQLTLSELFYYLADFSNTLLGRVLFTQDDDFLAVAHRYQAEGKPFPGVIYAHQRDVSIGDCVKDLEMIAAICNPEDLVNRVQFLPF
ncbi:MAG: hypothetical protein NW220_13060 [Leptolyngbyaceae cyanobacterium bins.349]|nr:hypothetical protein [Leptolyngbyaceae cyanobacterium bins.349]